MGEQARQQKPIKDNEVLQEAQQLVEVYAERVSKREESQVESHLPRRISLTRFPHRLEQASSRGLSWGVVVLIGFSLGVAVMAFILS